MRGRKIKRRFMQYLSKPSPSQIPCDYDHMQSIFWQIFWLFHKRYKKKMARFDKAIHELWTEGRIAKVSEKRASGIEEPEFFVLHTHARIPRFRYIPPQESEVDQRG